MYKFFYLIIATLIIISCDGNNDDINKKNFDDLSTNSPTNSWDSASWDNMIWE